MSGIAGILHLDGAPVDGALLQRLNDSLAFRGPDARRIWTSGAVGFGHTLLRTSDDARHERQPASLDGNVWIAADARLDARSELIHKLAAAGRTIPPQVVDAELILHAYHVWGTACVERIIGDFAFAIWDGTARRLLCARDHFGLKSFYYACTGNSLIFSNTLDCLRLHPSVSQELNDQAIADFLLFDMNQDLATTSFADIRRLPPAHILTCERGTVSTHPYWTLPIATALRYNQADEYAEHFRELLDAAVADRMGSGSVSVLMSGGLDSPTVAASAKRVGAGRGVSIGLRAYTQVFERLIPDKERRYAALVADALQIPIEFLVADDCKLYDHFDDPGGLSSEPANHPMANGERELMRHVSAWSRVALTGLGADPGLATLLSFHFRRLIKKKQLGRALADAARYLAAEGRFSRLYIRTRWRNWFGPKKTYRPSYPVCLNEELDRKLDLGSRWKEMNRPAAPNDSIRPEAWQQMVLPVWANFFEGYDASSTRMPLDVRHPFFDLRLVKFLIALPALPWSSDKELLRGAARGVLPNAVRLRRKCPLAADPIVALLQQPESAWLDRFEAVPALERYVRRNYIPRLFRETDIWTAWINLRPISLNYWLKSAWPGACRTKLSGAEIRVS